MANKNWSKSDLQYLVQNYNKKPIALIEAHLNRGIVAIESKAYMLGFRKKNPNAPIIIKDSTNEKLKPMTLHNCPGISKKERVFSTIKNCIENKRPIRISPKTTIYVSIYADADDVDFIINNYKNKNI